MWDLEEQEGRAGVAGALGLVAGRGVLAEGVEHAVHLVDHEHLARVTASLSAINLHKFI